MTAEKTQLLGGTLILERVRETLVGIINSLAVGFENLSESNEMKIIEMEIAQAVGRITLTRIEQGLA